MDDRRTFRIGIRITIRIGIRAALLLPAAGLLLFVGGCLPNQSKTVTIERGTAKKVPLEEESEPTAASLNPFSSNKRAPHLELNTALFRERTGMRLKDKPEEQFRALDDARKMYQEILNYDPKNAEAFRGLGRVYVALRDFDRASATFEKGLEHHPKNGALWADYSLAYSKRNDFRGAVAKLNKALECEPESQEYLKMIGINYACDGQVDRAIDALSRARGRAAAHYYVARIFHLKNQEDLARRHTQMALDANPNYTEARTLLAELDERRPAAPAAPNVGLQLVAEE